MLKSGNSDDERENVITMSSIAACGIYLSVYIINVCACMYVHELYVHVHVVVCTCTCTCSCLYMYNVVVCTRSTCTMYMYDECTRLSHKAH